MAFFKKKTQNQEQGEKILKQVVGTKNKKNHTMYKLVHAEKGYRETHKILDNVIKEIKTELEQDMITPDEVEDRVYTLLEYELGHPLNMVSSEDVTVEGMEFVIQVPYTSSGVKGYTNMGGALVGSNIGEGRTRWHNTKLFVHDYGVEVEDSGRQIRFSDIVDVQVGAGKGRLVKTVRMVLFLRDGSQFVMSVMANDVGVLESLFRENISDGLSEAVSSVDDLLKYADLLERGLISEEEFERVKKRLL